MAADNPEITAADIITDVESRLDDPNLGAEIYLPWVSYGYQKLYNKLSQVGKHVRETLFGASEEITLTTAVPQQINLVSEIPRFGGFIAVDVKYGATGDVYNRSTKIPSISHLNSLDRTTTQYWSKLVPRHILVGTTLYIIPAPPETGAVALVWYVKRPYQITEAEDVIEIPYRFLYPVVNYVHAMATRRSNEDYREADLIEKMFLRELEEVADSAASEFSDEEGEDAVQVPSNSEIFRKPF